LSHHRKNVLLATQTNLNDKKASSLLASSWVITHMTSVGQIVSLCSDVEPRSATLFTLRISHPEGE